MTTVARRPERSIFLTPSCVLRAKLARLETPHPLPLTLTMYTVAVLEAATSSEAAAGEASMASTGDRARPMAASPNVVVDNMLVFMVCGLIKNNLR